MRSRSRSLLRPVLLAASFILVSNALAAAQTCGDVSGDQNVTASDALLVLKEAVGQDVELTCTGECAALQARVEQLEELLAAFSLQGDTVVLTGVNLQVVSGSGSTGGPVNGTGNLIIGYNEAVSDPDRSGSHNIVVGREHAYTSFGGIVAGNANTIDAPEAAVLGGKANVASGDAATVTGGLGNEASGDYASVAGGNDNTASSTYASVAGGFQNSASGQHATIAGGCENTATAQFAHVSGGQQNDATKEWATVSGGFNHASTGTHDWRAGTLFENQ